MNSNRSATWGAYPLWWPLARLLATWAVVWAVAAMFTAQCVKAYSLGNGLSDLADGYSEANAIKGAEGYVVNGFTWNAGLPDVAYGEQFDHSGGKHDPALCETPKSCVYLHYPEGPDVLAGIATKIFGIGHVLLFRTFPLLVGLFGLTFLAYALVKTSGVVRAAGVMVALWYVPMASNMMHGLHYQGYAMSLLFVQIGVALFAFRSPRVKRKHFVGMAILGFLQGWLSFDYCFLVTLAVVPFWLAEADWRARAKEALLLAVCAGGAFTFAHVLHLVQVAVYLGGVGPALSHMAKIAADRANAPMSTLPIPGRPGMIIWYWFFLLEEKKYTDFLWGAFVAGVIPLVWPRPRFVVPLWSGSLARESSWRALASFASAVVIGSMWILLMRAHANLHGHFLPRHYCLAYFMGALLIVRTASWSRAPLTEGGGANEARVKERSSDAITTVDRVSPDAAIEPAEVEGGADA
jgi:hypothetical protein